MLWTEEKANGYTPFMLEADDIRQVNCFAATMNVTRFLEWIQQKPLREQIAYLTKLVAYGTKYVGNEHIAAAVSQGSECPAAIATLTFEKGRSSFDFDQKNFFAAMEKASEQELLDAARFAFFFYALNDNWKKFPNLQPGSSG